MTSAILTTLFTMTVAATVAALAVMVLRLVLKRAPRWITCALWLVVFLRMLCPVSFELPVSVTGQVTEQLPIYEAVESTRQPVEQIVGGEPGVSETGPAIGEGLSPAVVPAGPSGDEILLGLWAAGVAGMLLWAVVSYGRLKCRISDAVRVEGNLYETDRVDSPFVCGFFRPRIYLPVGISDHDRDYVILHEQAHIRRLDHVMKPLAWAALSVHWFNPVLWGAYFLWCRDVETACDQAVVRRFGREDVAGYAAALLHLGHKRTVPQAVPLAFGEEDAHGRVEHILDYKHPGFWVAAFAGVMGLIVAVFLLADQDENRHGEQLEGVTIVEAHGATNAVKPLPLPDKMTRELVRMLGDYGHNEYSVIDAIPGGDDTTVWLFGRTDNTSFSFFTESLTLVRHSGDVYSQQNKSAQVDPAMARDPDYLEWLEEYEEFRTSGAPDQLYAMRNDYIGNNSNDIHLLDAMGVRQVTGGYTVELNTDQEPYSIDVILDGFPAFQRDQQEVMTYLRACGELFLALVGNAEEINFIYATPLGSVGHSVTADPAQKDLTQEEFRDLYYQVMPEKRPTPNHVYEVTEVLYQDVVLERGSSRAHLFSYPSWEASIAVASSHFMANISSPFSSALPVADTYEPVIYHTGWDPEQNLTTRDGEVILDLSGHESVDIVSVMDQECAYTPYTLFLLDEKVYLACITPPVQTGAEYTVEFVVELEEAGRW